MAKKDRLILALDVDSLELAKKFFNLLFPLIKTYKVGPQLFLSCGQKIIEFIKEREGKIFLDLKFFDIPNTVANSCRQVVRLGVDMFSLHLQGGLEMLEFAVRATKEEARQRRIKKPFLLGVSVLTSQDKKPNIKELSQLIKKAGLDGVICSAREAKEFRENLGKNFLIVTPGIRPSGFSFGDQKRIATPKEAILHGADYLVIGRPILEADNPLKVTKDILEEVYGAKRINRNN